MNKKFTSIYGYLAMTSGILWLGAYLSKILITYRMFEEREPVIKNIINDSNLSVLMEMILPVFTLASISYIIMIISFTLYLTFSSIKLKENGWLFIIAVIIYITLPFEILLLVEDYNLIILILNQNFGYRDIINLLTDGLMKLGSFPIILIISYISIPYFLVFKPFTLIKNNEN